MFRVLQHAELFPQLLELVLLSPYSRKERAEVVQEATVPVVEQAWRFYVRSRLSFAGAIDRVAWGFAQKASSNGMASTVDSYLRAAQRLPQFHARLRGVILHDEDWRHILARYDHRDTLFYLDPPYVPTTRRSGRYYDELSMQDHEELIERLLVCRGQAILSGYPNKIYVQLEHAGWRRLDTQLTCMLAGATRSTGKKGAGARAEQQRQESIWISPSR
jgi:DNA adenine methylase